MKKASLLFVVVALLGFAAVANAADVGTVGFKFGINYFALPTDDRFSGSGDTFAIVFPLDVGANVQIYHEAIGLSGKDTVAAVKVNGNLNVDINELRIVKEIASIGGAPVDVLIGLGHASVTCTLAPAGGVALNADSPVADIGVVVTPLRAKGKALESSLSLGLMYRLLKVPNTDFFGAVGAATGSGVDNLGGFTLGLSAGLTY